MIESITIIFWYHYKNNVPRDGKNITSKPPSSKVFNCLSKVSLIPSWDEFRLQAMASAYWNIWGGGWEPLHEWRSAAVFAGGLQMGNDGRQISPKSVILSHWTCGSRGWFRQWIMGENWLRSMVAVSKWEKPQDQLSWVPWSLECQRCLFESIGQIFGVAIFGAHTKAPPRK